MSTLRFAVIVVAAATLVLQLVLTRLSGRPPHPIASLILGVYVSLLAVALRLWPIPTLVVLAGCVLVVLWLCRAALLAARDVEQADLEVGEKVGRP
jgi:hypothetical protein